MTAPRSLMGEISSASALAISQVAARNKRLFMALGPRSDTLRGKSCNRYMFCTDIPNTVMVNAVGSALLRDGMVKGKKFHTLTADYVFGHDLLRAAKAFFAANDATLTGDELVATDVTDFSPYLLKIRQAKPDVVCLQSRGQSGHQFRQAICRIRPAVPDRRLQSQHRPMPGRRARATSAAPGRPSGITRSTRRARRPSSLPSPRSMASRRRTTPGSNISR